MGFTGQGVRVGILDEGRVGTHTELNSSDITRLDPSSAVSSHSTLVARILCGINGPAKDATVFSTSANVSSEISIEQLISQNVSVINVSLAYGSPSGNFYSDQERWMDHVANQHDVTIVTVAGNDGVANRVVAFGLAFNVITVGATDPNGTTSINDDTFCDYTCTYNGGSTGCAKPDFLAPGQMLGTGGTSFAAPLVAGVIAQMIEFKPSIATKPELIKAVLTASCEKKYNESLTSGLTAQEGAGAINARRAIWVLSMGRYSTGTMSTGTVTKTFTVTSSDSSIRASVAWVRPNTASGNHNNGVGNTATHPNLRLQANKPNGTTVTSNLTTSSVELVYYKTNGSTGTCTIRVTRMDSQNNSFQYAIAWD